MNLIDNLKFLAKHSDYGSLARIEIIAKTEIKQLKLERKDKSAYFQQLKDLLKYVHRTQKQRSRIQENDTKTQSCNTNISYNNHNFVATLVNQSN